MPTNKHGLEAAAVCLAVLALAFSPRLALAGEPTVVEDTSSKFESLAAALESETRDRTWTESVEPALDDVLAGDESVASWAVECATTLCEVTFRFDTGASSKERTQAQSALRQAATDVRLGRSACQRDDDQGGWSCYFAREGFDFPLSDSE